MRSRFAFVLSLTLASAAAASSVTRPAFADFDPDGRGKKKPPKPGGGGSHGPPTAQGNPPTAQPTKPPDKGDDGRSTEALIARYTGIVMAQPGATFPIQRLTQLYRERDGNLAKLIEEFEKRAADGSEGSWAAKIALAGFYKAEGRYDDAVKTYEAASADKPKEAAPILALAQLKIDRGELRQGQRAEEEKALPLLKEGVSKSSRRRCILMERLCLDMKDFDAAKTYHDALVARSARLALREGRARSRAPRAQRATRTRRGGAPRRGQGRIGRQPRPRARLEGSRLRPHEGEEARRSGNDAREGARNRGPKLRHPARDHGHHERRLPRRRQAPGPHRHSR